MTNAAATYRNPKGHVLGAPWTFLLPSATPERVLVVGRPSRAARDALGRLAPVEVRRPGGTADLPDGDAPVVAVLGTAARRLRRGGALAREVARLLPPDGVVYVDGPVPPDWGVRALDLAVTPVLGEPRTLAPVADAGARRALAERGFSSPIVEPERLEGPARRLVRGPLARMGWRRATLAARSGHAPPTPLAWLHDVATVDGVDVSGMRWALSAAGRYRSRKVVLFLFDPGDDQPRYVVKLPRHPDEGGRLEREATALAAVPAVAGAGVVVPGRAFFGHVGREQLPVLGQSAVEGVPFRAEMTRRPDDPLLERMVAWLSELAGTTARPAARTEVEARLGPVLDAFRARCRPSDEEQEVLGAAVAALVAAPMPLVLEHGDLGVWNLLVDSGRRPVVLDWEAGEPDGMPLWDVLYLVRSYAASSAGRAAEREAAVFALMDGRPPFGPVLSAAVERVADRVQLDRDLFRPLLLTCWTHRAVKEASRREEGPYRRLVRRCVERREALFTPAPAAERSGR